MVILSAYDNPTYVARAAALGADDYVLKNGASQTMYESLDRAGNGKTPPPDSRLTKIRRTMRGRLTYRRCPRNCPLTGREAQVLRHVALGLSNKEIARSLAISVETVKEHVQNILRKIEANDRTDAAVRAIKLGILDCRIGQRQLRWFQTIGPHPRPQRFRNRNAAVGSLMVLENRDHRATGRDGGSIERMNEVGSFLPGRLEPHVQSTSLVVGAVAGAGNFSPLAAIAPTGHPGFEIKLAIGRSTQVPAGGIDDSIGNFQCVEDLAFEVSHFFMHWVTLVGQGEGEHFDLGELMDSIKSF